MEKFIERMNKSEYTMDDFKRSMSEVLPNITPQDLTGKVVIVTGANVGIGYETTKAIASMNPKLLILACRNADKANAALKSIKEATGFPNLEVMDLDLASYASVRNFAHNFLSKGLPLDILVNNAGVAHMTQKWIVTADGNEITIQINHLSTMLLTLLLTPALAKSPKSRVVVVSSDTHFWTATPAPDDVTPIKTLLTPPDGISTQYPASKLMNVLFSQEYARRCPHKNITICATNPGLTESELGSKDPTSGLADGSSRPKHDSLAPKPTYEGAKTIIQAAIDTDIVNGGYYSEMRTSRTVSTVKGEVGERFAANVWRDSIAHLSKEFSGENVEAWITN